MDPHLDLSLIDLDLAVTGLETSHFVTTCI